MKKNTLPESIEFTACRRTHLLYGRRITKPEGIKDSAGFRVLKPGQYVLYESSGDVHKVLAREEFIRQYVQVAEDDLPW